MNAIAALMLIVAGQDAAVPENFAKYFARAEEKKVAEIALAKNNLFVEESNATSLTGSRLAAQKLEVASRRKKLKETEDSVPHAYLKSDIGVGEIGMFSNATTHSVIDSKSVLATVGGSVGKYNGKVAAILVVDQSSRLKLMRSSHPDYVFQIIQSGDESTVAEVSNAAHRKALEHYDHGRFKYVVAEYIKKADLVKYRNSWEASRK